MRSYGLWIWLLKLCLWKGVLANLELDYSELQNTPEIEAVIVEKYRVELAYGAKGVGE